MKIIIGESETLLEHFLESDFDVSASRRCMEETPNQGISQRKIPPAMPSKSADGRVKHVPVTDDDSSGNFIGHVWSSRNVQFRFRQSCDNPFMTGYFPVPARSVRDQQPRSPAEESLPTYSGGSEWIDGKVQTFLSGWSENAQQETNEHVSEMIGR